MIHRQHATFYFARSQVSATTAIFVALLCQGCGGERWQAATYPTTGTLTINGEPAAGAVIELYGREQQPDVRHSRPWAIVQPDGSFQLSTYEKGDGAPLGRYDITVRWPPDVTQPSLSDRLGGAFATPPKSKWQATIIEGENQLPSIAIEGVRLQDDTASGKAAAAPLSLTPPGMPLEKGHSK